MSRVIRSFSLSSLSLLAFSLAAAAALAFLPADSHQALAAPLPALAYSGGAPRNVILIGWDGAQRAHVNEYIARGELPNLVALGKEGALVDIDITEVTDTKAGWSQILTGYKAEKTGVYSNGKYQPIPAGYTVFERLEAHFGADNFATLAVIGKGENVGADPPKRWKLDAKGNPVGVKRPKMRKKLLAAGKIVDEGGVRFLEIPGKPFYNAKPAMDLYENALGKNENVGKEALKVLGKYKAKPFFFFVHFADVDSNGHKHGENSQEYTDALISCDLWLGKIRARLGTLGLAGYTLIYVTADHGFDEGQKQHKNAPYVFLATNDAEVSHGGTRMDIAPTILACFGLDVASYEPPIDGQSLLGK